MDKYESNATPEEKQQKLNFMYEQLKLIKAQEADGIPLQHSKIRCGCNKLVKFIYMYRCLYCGIWYCKDCAEEHFGALVDTNRSGPSGGEKVQNWTITYNPKPIPDRRHDYDVCHDDYDIGRPELFFTAESKEEAQKEIDILEHEFELEKATPKNGL